MVVIFGSTIVELPPKDYYVNGRDTLRVYELYKGMNFKSFH